MTENKTWVHLPFQQLDLREDVGRCDTCPLACRTPELSYVPFEIIGDNPSPDVLFVAEAPFKDEIKQQRPLIGKSGSFLRDVLDQYLDSYALANVVSCHPTDTRNIHTPEADEGGHCVEHVFEFIDQIQPKLVILLGKVSFANVLPKSYLESLGKDAEYVGKMQKKKPVTINGITYACSYHPSYITRSGGVKSGSYPGFNARLKQIFRSLSGELDVLIDIPEDDLSIKFVAVDDLPSVLSDLEQYDDIGLDYEAKTLDPWFVENTPTGFSLSVMTGENSGISYYVMIDREFTEQEKRLLINFFKRKSPWTYNAKYETNMTWAYFGERVRFNDTFTLCKIDCSPAGLKANAQKYIGADIWEEEVLNIVDQYEQIFILMTKHKKLFPEVVELLRSGKLQEAKDFLAEDEKKYKKVAKLFKLCDDLKEIITEEDFDFGIRQYPYQWAAVPTETLGEYCCWDSYLTVKLKKHLWKDHSKQYQYYITQTWLAGNMEAYGYNWHDDTATKHNSYYMQEAVDCLYKLITMLDLDDEDRLNADAIMQDPDPNLTPEKRLVKLKEVFNPLTQLVARQEPFWKAYRTPFTETLAFLKYMHIEVGQSDALEDDIYLSKIRVGVPPEQIVTEMLTAAGKSRRRQRALMKILSGMEDKLDFYFQRFAIEITSFHYEAHTEFGGVDVDNPTTWNREFEMMYFLKRFKKIDKVNSTYIKGKTGRQNVWLAQVEDRRTPPRRIKNYYDVEDGYILKPNERWILNADFRECAADTKRWRAGIHTVPASSELREIYQPRTPTSVMIHADYAQNEVRFLAKMAEEKNLMEAFERGVDVHRFVASNIFKKPESEVTGTERSYAKAATFGLLYGKTVASFAQEMMGGDLAGAKRFFKEFFDAFPGIKRFVDAQHLQVLENGYVYTIFGDPIRINTEFYREDEVLRRAQNYPIQSSASALGAHAIYILNEAVMKHGLRAAPLGFCHDACDWDVEIADLFEFLPLMHECMVGYIRKRFGIPVDIDWELGIHQNFMMDLKPIDEENKEYKFECPSETFYDIVNRMETGFEVEFEIEEVKKKPHSMKDLFAKKGAFSKVFGTEVETLEGIMKFSEK